MSSSSAAGQDSAIEHADRLIDLMRAPLGDGCLESQFQDPIALEQHEWEEKDRGMGQSMRNILLSERAVLEEELGLGSFHNVNRLENGEKPFKIVWSAHGQPVSDQASITQSFQTRLRL